MNYAEVAEVKLAYPKSSFAEFKELADQLIQDFPKNNAIIQKLENGTLTLDDFHNLLLNLFHQVYMSSSSFALAGAMCDSRMFRIREYLMEHAEEEKEHWTWIVSNLRDTGYTGVDPREKFPNTVTQAYTSFALFLGHKHPVARLAMAYILEGLSGLYGVKYGRKILEHLKLTKEQVSFFVLHGELDAGHSDDVLEVLENAELTPYEWAYCCHAARCTAELYKNMYNNAAKQSAKTNGFASNGNGHKVTSEADSERLWMVSMDKNNNLNIRQVI